VTHAEGCPLRIVSAANSTSAAPHRRFEPWHSSSEPQHYRPTERILPTRQSTVNQSYYWVQVHFMIHFRVRELLIAKEIREQRRISMREVAGQTGISPQVLSSLTAPGKAVVTNTAFVESLCRYFECGPSDLMELVTHDGDSAIHVDQLYPERRRQ
jgi:DNA-binding Xre family transcriptional regulator